jgi:hypothetical protein
MKAKTECITFNARVASFYESNKFKEQQLIKDFDLWLKEKGKQNEFLVFDVTLTRREIKE